MRLIKIFFAVVLAWAFIFVPAQVSAESTTVILVRHGETFYNAQKRWQGILDIELNENGLNQAKLLAKSLKDYPIDVFISSPLKRAYVTTETVAKMHGKTIAYTDDRLKEINYGDCAGLNPTELKEQFPKEYELWTNRPWLVTFPNGESLRDVQYRARNALEDAVAKYPGQTLFIGAHSHTNAVIICSVLGLDPHHFPQIRQNNTCVNVLRYEDGVWKIIALNSVAHLGKLTLESGVMK